MLSHPVLSMHVCSVVQQQLNQTDEARVRHRPADSDMERTAASLSNGGNQCRDSSVLTLPRGEVSLR